MLNAFLYISLHGQDMAVLAEDFGAARAHARKRVYARVLALQCVEFFDDVPKLIKDTVHSDAALLGALEGRALLDATARLRPIRRKYEILLRTIRNASIAHRDLDAIKQLESMTAIDVLQFFRLLSEMYAWRTELTKAFLPVLKRMGERLSAATTRLTVVTK